ncbi:unnamed protein product [Brachionus calyciflorus]|uniref:Uncharacterized protein n=1 Tax=Brachionus calyciflorus TaxID=104777 RepID=A0A813M267_9BILA|nr:unnamed protein product [Brachionus calyciflorus]
MNTQDTLTYYTKVLQDLKNFELDENDSEETETNTKVAEFKRELASNGNKLKTDLENSPIETSCKIIELIAELAKDENCRDNLINANLFIPINNYLQDSKSNKNIKIQICRALGNLCYENDNGRLNYLNTCRIDNLISLLNYCGNTQSESFNSREDQKEFNKLVLVSLGCLHNVTNDNESLRKAFYDHNIMKILKDYLKHLKLDMGIMMYFFSCIENLTELDEGKTQFVLEKLALGLYESLDSDVIDNIEGYSEDFFRILSSINEINKSKEFLCETDFLELVISYIEDNVEDEELLRSFGGFITNLLVNDDNIDIIFKYRNNLILEKATEWLDKFENEQLYLSSAVIIANYMRNDEKTLELIKHENKPHVKIIQLLKKYNKLGSKATLQQINVSHCLLSTLKNFCIAASSKEELLKHDVIEVVLEFLNFENLEVIWKAVSVIRLLVKSCNEKNGLSLIFTDNVLEKIEKISNNPQEHAGVAGESSRLCCYLPIAAKSERNIEKYCQFKFINIVCQQLKSEHLIMLNEASLAVNVLIAINYRACFIQLKESTLNENLKYLFEKESVLNEIRINLFKIFKSLFERSDFFTEEQLEDYLELFKKIKIGQENEVINSYLNQLINLLDRAV